jgi:hypothetical protein
MLHHETLTGIGDNVSTCITTIVENFNKKKGHPFGHPLMYEQHLRFLLQTEIKFLTCAIVVKVFNHCGVGLLIPTTEYHTRTEFYFMDKVLPREIGFFFHNGQKSTNKN